MQRQPPDPCRWPTCWQRFFTPQKLMITDYNDLSPAAAVALQAQLREQIRLVPLTRPVQTIAGADISFNRFSDVVYAGMIVLRFPSLEVIDRATVITTVRFPYIPGLLAFREVPVLLQAWAGLTVKPDVLVLDGHGTAHPRKTGVATHFGIVAGTPTIGCAKSRLTGRFDPLPEEAMTTSDLILKGEKIGEALRTKKKTNPVFVSPGHLITQEESTELIRQCVTKYRIPEPTRLAHLLVNEVRIANGAGGMPAAAVD